MRYQALFLLFAVGTANATTLEVEVSQGSMKPNATPINSQMSGRHSIYASPVATPWRYRTRFERRKFAERQNSVPES